MRVLDLFSGVGGFSLAFEHAGFETVAFSEVEKFPCEVLAHHWPETPNLGDATKIKAEDVGAVDVITGGFPCQDLSVAGKRAGLAGDRSRLFWQIIRLAGQLKPTWLVLENVPGLLSSNKGRDFGLILDALGELGYGLAWRVLDAQNFGVPQRRRRVFIVGYLGGPCPPEVLFEPEGVCGDTEESGAEGEGVTPLLEVGARTNGDGNRDGDGIGEPGDPMYTLQARHQHGIVANCLTARYAKGTDSDATNTVAIVTNQTGRNGLGDSKTAYTLDQANGQPLPFDTTQITSPQNGCNPQQGDPCHPLAAHAHPPAMVRCYQEAQYGVDKYETAGTLPKGRIPEHQIVLQAPQAFALRGREDGAQLEVSGERTSAIRGAGGGSSRDYVGFYRKAGYKDDPVIGGSAPIKSTQAGETSVATNIAVRRLTPLECERLQGFPDGFTDIPGASDTTRYRAMGNAVAVPVAEWIARRLARG